MEDDERIGRDHTVELFVCEQFVVIGDGHCVHIKVDVPYVLNVFQTLFDVPVVVDAVKHLKPPVAVGEVEHRFTDKLEVAVLAWFDDDHIVLTFGMYIPWLE